MSAHPSQQLVPKPEQVALALHNAQHSLAFAVTRGETLIPEYERGELAAAARLCGHLSSFVLEEDAGDAVD